MSRNDDTPLLAKIISRIIATFVVALMTYGIRYCFYSPPDVGKAVAVAAFGDDAIITKWTCNDGEGYYDCTNEKASSNSDNTERDYYDIPESYEVIDTYGGYSKSSLGFAVRDTTTGLEYTSETEKNPGSFKILGLIEGPNPEWKLVSVAIKRRLSDGWLYYENPNDVKLYENRVGGEPEEIRIPMGFSFLKASAYANSWNPIRYCRYPTEEIGECPKSSSMTNAFKAYASAGGKAMMKLMLIPTILLADLAVMEFLARKLLKVYKKKRTA